MQFSWQPSYGFLLAGLILHLPYLFHINCTLLTSWGVLGKAYIGCRKHLCWQSFVWANYTNQTRKLIEIAFLIIWGYLCCSVEWNSVLPLKKSKKIKYFLIIAVIVSKHLSLQPRVFAFLSPSWLFFQWELNLSLLHGHRLFCNCIQWNTMF